MLILTQDEKERAVNCSRRMYQTDMDSNLVTATERGRREGRAEGEVKGMEREREKWQGVVADKDAEIARLRAELDRK